MNFESDMADLPDRRFIRYAAPVPYHLPATKSVATGAAPGLRW
ncbi:hypothetical protein ACVXG7_09340 [Enterobacter hormaechei]